MIAITAESILRQVAKEKKPLFFPDWLSEWPELSQTTKFVYAALSSEADEDGFTRTSVSHIAKRLNKNRQVVLRNMKKLEALGFIGVEKVPGNGFICTFYWHEAMNGHVPHPAA